MPTRYASDARGSRVGLLVLVAGDDRPHGLPRRCRSVCSINLPAARARDGALVAQLGDGRRVAAIADDVAAAIVALR